MKLTTILSAIRFRKRDRAALLSSAEARVMISNNYHFEVAKATNGQKNGSAEESRAALIGKYLLQKAISSNRPGTKKTLNFHSEELLIVFL